MISHWLVKTEPEEYSYMDLCQEKKTCWDGVRNYSARNYLQKMKCKDIICIYHTGKERAIIGLGEVCRAAYPDPTADNDTKWLAVDICYKPHTTFEQPVSLAVLRAKKEFKDCLLLKQSRLSVMPLSTLEFASIQKLAKKLL